VQDNDVVSAVAAEVAGHARGGQDVPGRVVGGRIDGTKVLSGQAEGR
jgi:hypothetical protein